MTEPLTRSRLALALLVSLLLHLLLAGGLSSFDHRAGPDESLLIRAALVPAPLPPPPPVPAPEAEPAPPPPPPKPAPKPPHEPRTPAPTPPEAPSDGKADAPPQVGNTEDAEPERPRIPDEPERDENDEPGRDTAVDDTQEVSPQQALIGEARLEFEVYRGDSLRIGETRYHWVHDGTRYRMDTVTETTGLAGLLKPLRIEQYSEGDVGSDGLQPRRFVQDSKQAKPPDEQVDFDWTASQVMLRSGSKTTTHALTPGSQDMASLWLEIIWRAQRGGEFDLNVATGRRYTPRWFVPDDAPTGLDTALGRLLVKRLQVRAQPGDNQIEVWLAPDLRWLPVRIRFTDRKGDVYDQRVRRIEYENRSIVAAPATAAPGTAPSASDQRQTDSDIPIFLR